MKNKRKKVTSISKPNKLQKTILYLIILSMLLTFTLSSCDTAKTLDDMSDEYSNSQDDYDLSLEEQKAIEGHQKEINENKEYFELYADFSSFELGESYTFGDVLGLISKYPNIGKYFGSLEFDKFNTEYNNVRSEWDKKPTESIKKNINLKYAKLATIVVKAQILDALEETENFKPEDLANASIRISYLYSKNDVENTEWFGDVYRVEIYFDKEDIEPIITELTLDSSYMSQFTMHDVLKIEKGEYFEVTEIDKLLIDLKKSLAYKYTLSEDGKTVYDEIDEDIAKLMMTFN